jgi:hypothetical protein
MDKLTIVQLKKKLDEKGISYRGIRLKKDFIAILENNHSNTRLSVTEPEAVNVTKTQIEQLLKTYYSSTDMSKMIKDIVNNLFPSSAKKPAPLPAKKTAPLPAKKTALLPAKKLIAPPTKKSVVKKTKTYQQGFTGIKNVDLEILLQVDDNDLKNVCSTSKYLKSLCDEQDFWRLKFINKYGNHDRKITDWKAEYKKGVEKQAKIYNIEQLGGAFEYFYSLNYREKNLKIHNDVLINKGIHLKDSDFILSKNDQTLWIVSFYPKTKNIAYGYSVHTKGNENKSGKKQYYSIKINGVSLLFKYGAAYFSNFVKKVLQMMSKERPGINLEFSQYAEEPTIYIEGNPAPIYQIIISYDKEGNPIPTKKSTKVTMGKQIISIPYKTRGFMSLRQT